MLGLTTCTPESAPGPVLRSEYGKPLFFTGVAELAQQERFFFFSGVSGLRQDENETRDKFLLWDQCFDVVGRVTGRASGASYPQTLGKTDTGFFTGQTFSFRSGGG